MPRMTRAQKRERSVERSITLSLLHKRGEPYSANETLEELRARLKPEELSCLKQNLRELQP